jgi:putative spermidine/putrescine transport system substrate-binding protein
MEKTMKMKTIMMGGAAFAMTATAAMAEDMTIVSWGGAYSASQKAAYHDPYSANTGVNILNAESSAEAVA